MIRHLTNAAAFLANAALNHLLPPQPEHMPTLADPGGVQAEQAEYAAACGVEDHWLTLTAEEAIDYAHSLLALRAAVVDVDDFLALCGVGE